MTENTDVNKELGAVDIVDKIDNNQRASAIDAIHDMLFGKASQAVSYTHLTLPTKVRV